MRKSYDTAFKVKVAIEADRDRLLTTVGKLTIENEFLKKKYSYLYGSEF